MTTIAFDTLAYSKTLQAAGMPAAQADALANAQKTAIKEMVHAHDLATKKELYEALAAQKFSLIKWMIGLIAAQSGLLIAVITLLHQKP